MSAFLNPAFWTLVLSFAGVYAIFTLGLQIQAGTSGLPNFGHVASMAIGAYTMALLTTYVGLPLLVTIPLAMLASVVGALIIAIPTLQLRRIYFAVAAIAFSQIVQSFLINQDDITQGTRGVLGYDGGWREVEAVMVAALNNLGWADPDPKVPIVIVTWTIALVIALLLRWLVKSPWGRTMRAIREDPDAARALGKAVLRQRLVAVSIGSAIAGLAGVFYAFDTGIVYPNFFDVSLTFLAFTMLIVGGAGSPLGALLGTLIISVVYAGPQLLDLPFGAGQVGALRLVVIGLLLILVIAFRPQGLFGRRQEMLFEDE
jgi:branched-chain amino acid transport system permease protein